MSTDNKIIVIYPHIPFFESDGGTTVQYFLAATLRKLGSIVKICNVHDNNSRNEIYNEFIEVKDIDLDNSIIVYCEGTIGNPLNAKFVVRWMLSKLGQNVPEEYSLTWGKNELIYFFNSEIDILNKNKQIKFLSVFYLNEKIENLNIERTGVCYTNRKFKIHKKITKIHPENAFEIERRHTHQECIDIFNISTQFISYDPLSFLTLIAPSCGCISVVYPIDGVSKNEYLKMTAIHEYLTENQCNLYGLAYGMSEDELNLAKNTIHLAKTQMIDIQKWFETKYIVNFLSDMKNFNKNENTIGNYKFDYKYLEPSLDIEFYKRTNKDLQHMGPHELIKHYYDYGKKEGRIASERQIKEFVKDEEFDHEFYKRTNKDLKDLSLHKLIKHYNNYGKKEGRFVSERQIKEFVKDEDFDFKIYKMANDDLKDKPLHKIIKHYNDYGKKEGRIASERQIKEFVKDEDFDFTIYKMANDDLKDMSLQKLIKHYNNYGKKEGRIASERQLIQKIEDKNKQTFDLNYYKLFNNHLNDLPDCKLLMHYLENKNCNVKDISEVDYFNLNNEIRFEIKTYDDVKRNFEIKLYDIYNKETFLEYYRDFDVDFYKDKYFKDTDISEIDIFLHYHQIGKKQKLLTNNNITIVLYSLILNPNCGGIVVMHNMVKFINNLKIPNIKAKLFNPFNIKYKNQFTNEFCTLDEINDNYIVVYPEIFSGNILLSKNVMRWILLGLGIEMSKDHYMNWGRNDLVYVWEPTKMHDIKLKQLCLPWFNPTFKNNNNNNERTKTCYMFKKGHLIHKNITQMHDESSIKIDDYMDHSSLIDYPSYVCDVFNECKYFYCYDPNSCFSTFAAICGCIPIVFPLENVSKEDYLTTKMFNCGGTIVDFIAYGNSEYEINKCEQIIKNINIYIEFILEYYKQTVVLFINDIKSEFTTKSIVTNPVNTIEFGDEHINQELIENIINKNKTVENIYF